MRSVSQQRARKWGERRRLRWYRDHRRQLAFGPRFRRPRRMHFGFARALLPLCRQFMASKRRTDMSGVLRYCLLQTLALGLIIAFCLVGPANNWRTARAAEDSSATT